MPQRYIRRFFSKLSVVFKLRWLEHPWKINQTKLNPNPILIKFLIQMWQFWLNDPIYKSKLVKNGRLMFNFHVIDNFTYFQLYNQHCVYKLTNIWHQSKSSWSYNLKFVNINRWSQSFVNQHPNLSSKFELVWLQQKCRNPVSNQIVRFNF